MIEVSATFVATTTRRLLARRKDALLLAGGHSAEKPEHLDACAEAAFEQIARLADVALGRHEDEHVAVVRLDQRVLHRAHRGLDETDVVIIRQRSTARNGCPPDTAAPRPR